MPGRPGRADPHRAVRAAPRALLQARLRRLPAARALRPPRAATAQVLLAPDEELLIAARHALAGPRHRRAPAPNPAADRAAARPARPPLRRAQEPLHRHARRPDCRPPGPPHWSTSTRSPATSPPRPHERPANLNSRSPRLSDQPARPARTTERHATERHFFRSLLAARAPTRSRTTAPRNRLHGVLRGRAVLVGRRWLRRGSRTRCAETPARAGRLSVAYRPYGPAWRNSPPGREALASGAQRLQRVADRRTVPTMRVADGVDAGICAGPSATLSDRLRRSPPRGSAPVTPSTVVTTVLGERPWCTRRSAPERRNPRKWGVSSCARRGLEPPRGNPLTRPSTSPDASRASWP